MESLDTPLVEMFVLSIYYWLTKFVQEVAKPSKERYPPKTLYGIISGIRRFLAEQKPSEDITPLNTSDKRYDLTDDFKQGTHTRAGVALQNKKAEKLPVTQEEENKFWEMGL